MGLSCFFCNSILKTDKRLTFITVYTSRGSFHAQHMIKRCRTCQAHFHYSYFTRYNVNYENNKLAKFFYDDCLEKEYFFPSSSTAFETDFLRSFYSEMCLCPEYSFYQKSMTYNLNVPTGNDVLVPKRFVEAFFQFALLDMWKLFNTQVGLSTLIQSHDVDRNISDLTSTLKHQFQQYYSTHRCNTPGCGTVIGFDADCKVNMSVIYSKVMCHVMWLFSIGGKFLALVRSCMVFNVKVTSFRVCSSLLFPLFNK